MKIHSFRELRVYSSAVDLAMGIFELTKSFPPEERYSLTDQIRRSSRSVCANIAEAWRKSRYKAAFIAKINDSETEATETQVWLELALLCKYITEEKTNDLLKKYDHLISQLVLMIHDADNWIIEKK
jgi:four helix bundle protein